MTVSDNRNIDQNPLKHFRIIVENYGNFERSYRACQGS
jgi:hypothetical protein